jgi:hypothetical protein
MLATRRLLAHPLTPCDVVDEIVVELGVARGDMLVVRYSIVGDLDRVRIPNAAAGLDPERLWEHTCCELFIAPALREDYLEWNFSPTGQAAHFAFSAFRQRISFSSTSVAAPVVTVQGRALRIEGRVPLPTHGGESGLHISTTTIIEDASGSLSYWALRHPCEKPEFHHRDGFALALTPGPPIAIVDR